MEVGFRCMRYVGLYHDCMVVEAFLCDTQFVSLV